MDAAVHSGDRSVPYAELLTRAARVARGYDALGVRPGDSVALLLRNDIAFLEASLGCAVLGANPVPINWHWRDEEVGYLLGDCEAKVLVGHDDLLAGIAVPEGPEILGVPTPPEIRAAYGIGEPEPAGVPRQEAWGRDPQPWGVGPPTRPSHRMFTH